ncbi:MAG TPA: hypothetical protein VJB94_01620 [Candidatus Nanoarchaeia archaeon]|nr:hypothetical protein [Candidatus Nanoarchaeia archaeon]
MTEAKINFCVRLDKSVVLKLQQKAKLQQRSVAGLIRLLIYNYLEIKGVKDGVT